MSRGNSFFFLDYFIVFDSVHRGKMDQILQEYDISK